MARKKARRYQEKIFIGARYGNVKPGLYHLISRGYDYIEIKYSGCNIFVPDAFLKAEEVINSEE